MKAAKLTRSHLFGLGVSMLTGLAVATASAQNDKPSAPPAPPAPGALAKQPTPAPAPTTPAAPAKAEQPSEPLPKAEDVLDRFVKETGGKEAYASLKSMVKTGKMSMMQIEGAVKEYVVKPNKSYSEIKLGELGEMKSGSDGETVWQDAMQGPRIVEGVERELLMEGANLGREGEWREWYKEVKCVGVENVKGKPAYKVELTPKDGTKRVGFYDKETGLAVKQKMTIESEMGTMPLEFFIADYKKVGDLTFPHKVTISLPTGEMVTTYEKIEVNVDVPDSKFELPAEVKELKEKKAKKAAEKEPGKAPEKK